MAPNENVAVTCKSQRVAFFSTKRYEQDAFMNALARADGNAEKQLDIIFFEHALNAHTALTCIGFTTVVIFVNDDICDQTIEILGNNGVNHIALRCAGFNNVNIRSAFKHNIEVSRVPAYSPETVAEHTLALMLTLNRKTHKAYNRVREGNFTLDGLLGFTLHKKTVGVIGTGKIGKAVIKILVGFGCNVLCYDPLPNDEVSQLGANYVPLVRIWEESAIITLHCPLNEQSYHLVNEQSLVKMRTGVMLINTSRGGLVDNKAIINGLKSGKIGYLGLDVYERESELFFNDLSTEIIQDDIFQRLTTFPNVLITGHQGFFTEEALAEIASTTLANILSKQNRILP